MIYDNLCEKFNQLEKSLENKRGLVIEREALSLTCPLGEITIIIQDNPEHEISLEINKDAHATDFKATVEKEIPEDDITGESSANTETENTKEGEMFTLFVAAYVIYCFLQLKCCQILSFRTLMMLKCQKLLKDYIK